jgi:hypothetical protein
MTATLKLTRDQNTPPELRRGLFEVSVDGRSIGLLENHGTFEAQIAPGVHRLRLRRGRYTSRQLGFDVSDGDSVTFRCHGARVWPTWLLSFAVPSMAISASQE